MPPIFEYHCDTCDFEMPNGTGFYRYVRAKVCSECGQVVHEIEDVCDECGMATDEVEADGFERVPLRHPNEFNDLTRILGEDPSEEKRKNRTGIHFHCVCLECLSQFDLDTELDDRLCPDCDSLQVKTQRELVGEECPKCTEGTFIKGGIIRIS